MSPKTILVTGCSAGGIGAAIALALAKGSYHVYATARNTNRIPQELSELSNVTILQLDVLSLTSINQAVESVQQSGRGLDILVNNAGAGYAMPVLDINIEKAQRLYDINVWGPVRTIQAFSKLLIASQGRIVNMSTCGAAVNTPWIAAYCSSKAALTNMSETLRLELGPLGVSVVTIMAGTVNSHFHDNDDELQLPPNSLYVGIKDTINGWATGELKPKGTSAENFAQTILDDIVGSGKGGLVWKGPNAGGIKALAQFGPRFVADAAMSYNQGLSQLEEQVTKESKK